MARTEEELKAPIDEDFRNVIQQMIDLFTRVSKIVHGRATHTTGIAARGFARIITPPDFPPCDFLKFGNVYPVVVRHATPRTALAPDPDPTKPPLVDVDDRTLDGGAMSIKFLQPNDASGLGFHDVMMNTGRVLFVRSARAFNTMIHTPFGKRAPLLRVKGKDDWVIDDEKLTEAYRTGSFTEFYYHSQIAFELTDSNGVVRYIKFRSIPGDRGPERGLFPPEIRAGGDTFAPRWTDDDRAENFRRTDFATRVNHLGVDYILQAQLHPSGDADALNPSEYWDERYHPWLDVAQIHLSRTLTHEEMDALEFDANRTHSSINLPLAKTADDYASMGHARALIYWTVRKARRDSPQPHRD
ncbi:catalase family protein [Paludisphaera rhizosphaerae]|uniref:hypothetical protein n=1 Tax=Paludisphaera rhizosphaerae TaxID=2711216 RepID=UPI0013EAF00A|nr:hypothetical protein [Paludisphaera rhizosphaerae]